MAAEEDARRLIGSLYPEELDQRRINSLVITLARIVVGAARPGDMTRVREALRLLDGKLTLPSPEDLNEENPHGRQ